MCGFNFPNQMELRLSPGLIKSTNFGVWEAGLYVKVSGRYHSLLLRGTLQAEINRGTSWVI